MDFADEWYVRLFTRDTATWKRLCWQAKCLLPIILRKLDRAGVADIGPETIEGIAALTDMPPHLVAEGLPDLLKQKVYRLDGERLVMPKYIEAQEAKRSDVQRKREQRARDRRDAAATIENDSAVTAGHETSQPVTLYCAVLPSAVQIPPPAGAREGDLPGTSEQGQVPERPGDSPDHPEPAPGSELAAAILAELRRHPVLASLATVQTAEALALTAFDHKRSAFAAVAAVAEAAAKEGPRAATVGRREIGDLASWVAGCVRRGPSVQPRSGPPQDGGASGGALAALALWGTAYAASGRRYGAYVPAPGDEATAAAIDAQAERIAAAEVARRVSCGDPAAGALPSRALVPELLRFWFEEFLRLEGERDYLVTRRHALAFLERWIPTIGSPWSRAKTVSRAKARDSPQEQAKGVGPPADLLAAIRFG